MDEFELFKNFDNVCTLKFNVFLNNFKMPMFSNLNFQKLKDYKANVKSPNSLISNFLNCFDRTPFVHLNKQNKDVQYINTFDAVANFVDPIVLIYYLSPKFVNLRNIQTAFDVNQNFIVEDLEFILIILFNIYKDQLEAFEDYIVNFDQLLPIFFKNVYLTSDNMYSNLLRKYIKICLKSCGPIFDEPLMIFDKSTFYDDKSYYWSQFQHVDDELFFLNLACKNFVFPFDYDETRIIKSFSVINGETRIVNLIKSVSGTFEHVDEMVTKMFVSKHFYYNDNHIFLRIISHYDHEIKLYKFMTDINTLDNSSFLNDQSVLEEITVPANFNAMFLIPIRKDMDILQKISLVFKKSSTDFLQFILNNPIKIENNITYEQKPIIKTISAFQPKFISLNNSKNVKSILVQITKSQIVTWSEEFNSATKAATREKSKTCDINCLNMKINHESLFETKLLPICNYNALFFKPTNLDISFHTLNKYVYNFFNPSLNYLNLSNSLQSKKCIVHSTSSIEYSYSLNVKCVQLIVDVISQNLEFFFIFKIVSQKKLSTFTITDDSEQLVAHYNLPILSNKLIINYRLTEQTSSIVRFQFDEEIEEMKNNDQDDFFNSITFENPYLKKNKKSR